MNISHQEYKSIFFEILNSTSSISHSFFGSIFIKHLSYLEVSDLDIKYNVYLNEAINSGIPTYKEKEKQIISDKLWTDNDEIELIQNQKIVQDLRIDYSKDYLISRRRNTKKQIKEFQSKINSLEFKKSHYIGSVAEEFANKKLMYYRIINSFHINKECTQVLVSQDEIEDDKYEELMDLYIKHNDRFNADNIKKIALYPFFSNIFSLCDDNVYTFFGKPIVQLTNYQTELFYFGRYFKNILSNHSEIPKEVLSNPDELMDWIDIQNNAKKAGIISDGEDDAQDGSMSVMGATKEDLEALGLKVNQRFNLGEELKKSGGKLNAEQLYNLTK